MISIEKICFVTMKLKEECLHCYKQKINEAIDEKLEEINAKNKDMELHEVNDVLLDLKKVI